jgi:hypothetical protein
MTKLNLKIKLVVLTSNKVLEHFARAAQNKFEALQVLKLFLFFCQ